jgi:FMN reductase
MHGGRERQERAHARLVWVRDLDLPLYTADLPVPRPVQEFVGAVYACDAMIWSSPTYHGSVSGSFKNALDWLILLAEHDPPYLTNKPVGLVTTAGGVQGGMPRWLSRQCGISAGPLRAWPA